MKWTTNTPREVCSEVWLGNHTLYLKATSTGEGTWCHAQLMVSRCSEDRSYEASLEAWPREAIQMLRERLDEIEAELDANENRSTHSQSDQLNQSRLENGGVDSGW